MQQGVEAAVESYEGSTAVDVARRIDWGKLYDVLGHSRQFRGFAPGGRSIERVPEPSGYWSVPVIEGPCFETLVVAFRSLDVDVFFRGRKISRELTCGPRDLRPGSYKASFHRSVGADQGLRNLSVEQLDLREIKGISFFECFLLGLGYLVTTSKFLDDAGTGTICSGSRLSNNLVPVVSAAPGHRAIIVSFCSTRSRHGDHSVRELIPLS